MAANKGEIKFMIPNSILAMTRINEHKLDSFGFTCRDKNDYLMRDPSNYDTRQVWLRGNAHLFLRLQNSIHNEVISLINHFEFLKQLIKYLEFLYFDKGNISHIYDVCKIFYRSKKHDRSLTLYFMDFKCIYRKA